MSTRHTHRRVGPLLLIVALAACADAPAPAVHAQTALRQQPTTMRQPAATETAPPPPAARPLAPIKLKGLSEAEAFALLGEPSRRGERPPARIWTYETPQCSLELAFYLDVSTRGFRILSHQATPKGKPPQTAGDCLSQVRSARR